MIKQLIISGCVSKSMSVIDELRQLDNDDTNLVKEEIKSGDFYNLAAQI